MTMIVRVVVAVLLSLLATEVEKWLPWVSAWLIRYEASMLPRLSERMQEQWLADLDEFPGSVAKLGYAVSLVLRHFSIVSALPADEAEDAEPVIVLGGGASVESSTAIGVSSGSLGLTGNPPKVFVSYNYDSTLSAALSERLTIIDTDHVHLFNVSHHGSSGSGSNSKGNT
jgi:hypothetical protein